MKDKINDFASVIAVMILADGEFDPKETELLYDLEHDTELAGFANEVKKVINDSQNFNDDQLTDLLYNSAQKFSTHHN